MADDVSINVPTRALLDRMIGRRVQIGDSKVPLLRCLRGQKGCITRWRKDSIVRSEVLFHVKLDSGRVVAAGFYHLFFPIPFDTSPTTKCQQGDAHA